MTILDGKKISAKIVEEAKEKITKLNKEIDFAIIWVGNDPASEIYIKNKIKKCEYAGINVRLYHLEEDVSEEDVLNYISVLNKDSSVYGILLQSPVPKQIDISKCFNMINPKKDIDGFSNVSMGNLVLGKPTFIPCTPKGIMRLLQEYNIPLEGKNVCIINRSNIVGKPLMPLLLKENATVTMCHSKTKDLAKFTKEADILISAVGKPNFITADMVKDGVVVIDVGISRVNGKVIGDVDFENVSLKSSYITPVPGGVGPMTIAMILENIYDAVKERENG